MNEASLASATLSDAGARFRWSDGFEAEFAAPWLWDNAPASRASSGQRFHSALSVLAAARISNLAVSDDGVRIGFGAETVEWPAAALRRFAVRRARIERVLWPIGTNIAKRPAIPYASYLADDEALKAALLDVAMFGLARLDGAGVAPEAVEAIVRRFGFIRETNYGRLFEVRVAAEPDNLAHTARALEAHTDNPYRDPVPTLQLLHCIRNAGDGGATYFMDGFALAEDFRAVQPEHFARLATTPVAFTFTSASGEHYEAWTPLIRLAADGTLCAIRFNHRALAPLDLEAGEAARWYASYGTFAAAVAEAGRRLSLPLRPGDIVIFDNERVLHGREAFTGAAERLLSGCYADRDGLMATLARLSA
jgi:gamma-butyrobetaine dioxygenase